MGHKVEIRRRVGADIVEVRLAGRLIATHQLVHGRRVEVWNPQHRRAAETIALRRDLRLVPRDEPVVEAPSLRLILDDGDYDVAEPDLGERYRINVQDDGGVSA